MGNRKYDELYDKVLSILQNDGGDAAFKYLDDIIENDPRCIEAYLVRAEGHSEIECFDYAFHDVEEAIAINPNEAEAYVLRGMLHFKANEDINKALADFNKTIELDPCMARAYTNRSLMYLRMNELHKVISDCNKAIELLPDAFEPYNNRGMAYIGLEEHAKALQDYNKVIELAPDTAVAYFQRGALNSGFGNTQEAFRDFVKFLELDPNHKHAQLAEDAIKDLRSGKNPMTGKSTKGGCYVATCVYGSYDCPEVWTLRRFRDDKLSKLLFGKLFIRIYYSVSPKIVELFGNEKWFNQICKSIIDKFVIALRNNGVEDNPYFDKG